VRAPQNERVPGVFVFRSAGALLYFNVDLVRERLFELLAGAGEVRRVVYFLGAVPDLDLAGAELLLELQRTLRARGIEFRLAGTPSSVRERLLRASFEREYGPVLANETVDEVLAAAPQVRG
jgi:SulP family sulfate permease